jgi:hypothetical protein
MDSLFLGGEWHALQTQLPSSRIELRRCSQLSLRSFHSAFIAGAIISPVAALANGLIAANQKEPFPVWVLRSPVCCHASLSQAFEDRHFTLGCLRERTAAVTNPTATPVKGLIPATQNETFQSCAVPCLLPWRQFFAHPVRHRTVSPRHGEFVHRQTW